MSTNPQSLHVSVSEMIGTHGLDTFRRYWEVCNQAKRMEDVKAFYCFTTNEPKYGNVVILADDKVIDVEGDDSDGRGDVSIRNLSSIAAVHVHLAPIEGFGRAQGASLVVSTRLVGESNAGPYWIAATPQEREQLLQFASVLVSPALTTASHV